MPRSQFQDFFNSVGKNRVPRRADILAEGFREQDVRAVKIQCEVIAKMYAEGQHGEARSRVAAYIEAWEHKLANDPTWDVEDADPDALRAQVESDIGRIAR